jgi:hypothetical protein
LNPTHISLKNEKGPEIRTTKRAVLMFQSNDDEVEKTWRLYNDM